MTRKRKIFNFIAILVIILVFSVLYFYNHAYGAFGGDAPGYIFLASRIYLGKDITYQDPIVKEISPILDSKYIPNFISTRYKVINSDGYITSKYSLGLPLLLAASAKIFNNDIAFYYVIPFFAVLSLIGLYLLSDLIFEKEKFKEIISLFIVITVGFSDLFWDYARAQPKTEIPSIAFLIFTFYFFLKTIKSLKSKTSILFASLSGLLFGYSLNIRHPNLIFLTCLFCLLLPNIINIIKKRKIEKGFLRVMTIFILCTVIAFSITIFNSFTICKYSKIQNEHKIVLTSNQEDIQGFSFQNFFNNQGRYKAGMGSFNVYWQEVIPRISRTPRFLFFLVLALIYLLRKNYSIGLSLFIWFVSFLILYSFWVNPYHRYILPLFPSFALILGYGVCLFFWKIIQRISNSKTKILTISLLILIFLNLHTYAYAKIKNQFTSNTLTYKSLPKDTFLEIKEIKKYIDSFNELKPIVIYINPKFPPEIFEAHSGIRSITALDTKQDNKLLIDKLLEMNYTPYLWIEHSIPFDVKNYIVEDYLKTYQNELQYNRSKLKSVELIKISRK